MELRPVAAILLGPTGAGKTPLGEILAVYAQRTQPLVEHYGAAGATVLEVEVTSSLTVEEMWSLLQST